MKRYRTSILGKREFGEQTSVESLGKKQVAQLAESDSAEVEEKVRKASC